MTGSFAARARCSAYLGRTAILPDEPRQNGLDLADFNGLFRRTMGSKGNAPDFGNPEGLLVQMHFAAGRL